MILNKHQIFASNDLKNKVVEMKEWGGDVKIRVMSAGEQLALNDFLTNNPKDEDMAFHFILMCSINEDGSKMFDQDDIPLLKEKSAESVIKLYQEILSLNKQKADDVENLAKNF